MEDFIIAEWAAREHQLLVEEGNAKIEEGAQEA